MSWNTSNMIHSLPFFRLRIPVTAPLVKPYQYTLCFVTVRRRCVSPQNATFRYMFCYVHGCVLQILPVAGCNRHTKCHKMPHKHILPQKLQWRIGKLASCTHPPCTCGLALLEDVYRKQENIWTRDTFCEVSRCTKCRTKIIKTQPCTW